jgi:hypothetical protein
VNQTITLIVPALLIAYAIGRWGRSSSGPLSEHGAQDVKPKKKTPLVAWDDKAAHIYGTPEVEGYYFGRKVGGEFAIGAAYRNGVVGMRFQTSTFENYALRDGQFVEFFGPLSTPEPMRQTWMEWDKTLDCGILDPDGFRDKELDHLYTREEFGELVVRCTVNVNAKYWADRLAKEVSK